MKIVIISDTHTKHTKLIIPECDLLLHAGDFTNRGTESEVNAFAFWFGNQMAKHKVAIPGNHDFFTQQAPDICKHLFESEGCHLLIEESYTIDNHTIYGSPWQPWFHDWAWNFPNHDKVVGKIAKETWSRIPAETTILLTHTPPYGILDRLARPRLYEDPRVGCPQLRLALNNLKRLRLHAFGHIHEEHGIHAEGIVQFVNASASDLFMIGQNMPIIVNL
jgi:Icc-related predicted phosphoesterase